MNTEELMQTADYKTYHEQVVAACIDRFHGKATNDDGQPMTDDEIRAFFGNVCDYVEEFKDGIPPAEVADNQWDALT